MVPPFIIKFKVRWSDVDANGHVRNSAYTDFTTQARLELLQTYGITPQLWTSHQLGPVVVREETFYKRELYLLEEISVSCAVEKASRDFKKFGILQRVLNSKGEEAAITHTEVLWISLKTRKVVIPPNEMLEKIANFPQSDNFYWWEKKE